MSASPRSRRRVPFPLEELPRLGGRGLLVAVVDSGITAGHPHVGEVWRGASFLLDRRGRVARSPGAADRIGHGTACAGVIRELLPEAGLLAVRVFDRRLEAHAGAVAAGVRWAVEEGADLVNLSLLVLARGQGVGDLLSACREAARAGVGVVVARPEEGGRVRESGLVRRREVIAAGADPECPPGCIRPDGRRPPGFLASPFARPIPGVPPERNFRGPSLAAARVTGFAGKALQAAGRLPPRELRAILLGWAAPRAQVRC